MRGRMRSGALLLLLVLLIVVPFVVVEKVSLGVEGDERTQRWSTRARAA